MTTQLKIKPGQVFYIKALLSEGNKYYPLEITRVTAKCVFFTFDGINRRGELKTDKYGNQYFTKYCPECLVGVYHHTPMVNPDEPTEVETIEINSNVVSLADYRANVEPQAITPSDNVDTTEILETLENQPSDNLETLENQTPSTHLEYTLGQAVIRCHGKDKKTLLGTVTSIDDGMFIVTCLDGIEYWEDDLNILPDTRVNRINYGLSAPQTSNVINMFTRKPLQV